MNEPITEKKKWPAKLGMTIANGLMDFMRPHCEDGFLTFAGSLRRGKTEVGDVEILYVPKFGDIKKPGEMFCSRGNLADDFLNQLLGVKLEKRPNVNGGFSWGNENKLALHKATRMPLDLFATTKERWWVSLVIRTGPKEFNISLIQNARKRGLQLHAYGVFTELDSGAAIYPKSEREVLELAGMPWIEPKDRR